MELAQIIAEKIKKSGVIGFDEFMQLALYHPKLGYYRSKTPKLGKAGDFITSPETSDLFGFCIAKQIIEIANLQNQDNYNILEFGAGSGVMAAQILTYLQNINKLPKKYYILELSSNLIEWQKQNIKQVVPDLFDKVEWLESLPIGFNGVMVANEVLDAMPVKRAIIKNKYFYELGVGFENDFIWQKTDTKLSNKKYNLPDGYISEFNANNQHWIKSLSLIKGNWIGILIDYGFSESEFFHPDRVSGTLRCYQKHKADENPFIDIGTKDITSWVNFSSIKEVVEKNNLQVLGYNTQAMFLIALGIEEFLAQETSEEKKIQLASEIKQLVFPNAMGESFKVMVVSNTIKSQILTGFTEQNLLHKL